MADPITLGMIAMGGLSMAGTGLQVKGQLDQADTYSRLADIDSQVAQQNAEYSLEAGERQALYSEEAGQLSQQAGYEQGKEIRKQGQRLLGEQRATVGAAGLRTDTGSALLNAAETARNVELDALTSEYEGRLSKTYAKREADAARVGAQRQASELYRQGRMIQYDKQLKKRSATYQTIGTIFGGVSQAAAPFVAGMGGK